MIEWKQLPNGFRIPVLGLGTWMIGGDDKWNRANNDEADVRAITHAINNGVTHIDTAEKYAAGFAERLVGKAIKRFKREKLFITSKVWSSNLKYAEVIKSARNSLQRLETDYLDLYYIHRPNQNIPLKETIAAMDALLDAGLIRNLGVSNFSVALMEEAQTHAKNKIVANQVHYNLVFRRPERNGVLEYCKKNGVMLIAWRPLQEVCALAQEIFLLEAMRRKYDKTLAQIAINWLISQSAVATITTMRTAEHLIDNLGALDWKMENNDIELLRRELPQALREAEMNSSVVFGNLSMLMEGHLF